MGWRSTSAECAATAARRRYGWRGGANALTMHKDVSKRKKERHASHRRAAPKEYAVI